MKNVTFDRATRARDLFSNRVLLLHHPLHAFGRICCRVLNLPGCLSFEEHVHLRFRRHAVQKGPKGCRAATSRKRRAFKLRCRLRIGLRKPELPLRWSLRVRAIPCTVPCQGFHFPTIRASHHHPYDVKSAISVPRLFVKKNSDNCGAWGRELSKKSYGVAFQSLLPLCRQARP